MTTPDARLALADELKTYISRNDGTDPEWSLIVRCEAALRASQPGTDKTELTDIKYYSSHQEIMAGIASRLEHHIGHCSTTLGLIIKEACAALRKTDRLSVEPGTVSREGLEELLRHWERASAKIQHTLLTSGGYETRESKILATGLANVRAKTTALLSQ